MHRCCDIFYVNVQLMALAGPSIWPIYVDKSNYYSHIGAYPSNSTKTLKSEGLLNFQIKQTLYIILFDLIDLAQLLYTICIDIIIIFITILCLLKYISMDYNGECVVMLTVQ